MKLKEMLSSINYSILGFATFAGRLAICGASIGDAIALFAFAGLYGWQSWLKHQEVKKYNEKFEQDVKIEFLKAADELAKLKGVLGALNLGTTMSQTLRRTNDQR